MLKNLRIAVEAAIPRVNKRKAAFLLKSIKICYVNRYIWELSTSLDARAELPPFTCSSGWFHQCSVGHAALARWLVQLGLCDKWATHSWGLLSQGSITIEAARLRGYWHYQHHHQQVSNPRHSASVDFYLMFPKIYEQGLIICANQIRYLKAS